MNNYGDMSKGLPQEEWEEAKRVSKSENLGRGLWLTDHTAPDLLSLAVYYAVLRRRQGATDAWSEAFVEFHERFGERLSRAWMERLDVMKEAQARGEFDWVRAKQEVEAYKPFWEKLREDARPVIRPLLNTWFYGADNVYQWILVGYIMGVLPGAAEKLRRGDDLLGVVLELSSGLDRDAFWLNVVSTRRAEETLRKKTRERLRQHGYWLKHFVTIVKYADIWVEFNIPETPGGQTPTRDELAMGVGKDPVELSKALRPFDQAMGKSRRRGAPPGKRHRQATARGEMERLTS